MHFEDRPIELSQPLDSYVMENVLFKISFPAEFHAQTAVEAAVLLHPAVIHRLDEIDRICLQTHESAIRIIDKTGPLRNPADRDHCLQYMVAVGLLHGDLTADHYEDAAARDPRIDRLRNQMQVSESPRYSGDYLDPDKRSIANALQVFFVDGSSTPRQEVEYPIGHRRRRDEGLPLLKSKFEANARRRFSGQQLDAVLRVFEQPQQLDALSVRDFVDLFARAADDANTDT